MTPTMSHANLYIQQNYMFCKLNLPHRLCLWTFLKLSNVLPISESLKNKVNMNYITFNEPIGSFANDFVFYFHFFCHISNSYRWLHVVRRKPLNLSELVSLLTVLIISFYVRRNTCADSAEVVLSKQRYLLRGLSFTFKYGDYGKSWGLQTYSF